MLSIEGYECRHAGPGEVRVSVAAAGLNRADCLQRRGFYPAPPGAPKDIPGLEFAGTVSDVGEGARWSVGDRVMGIVAGGAMATELVVHGRELIPVPANLELHAAAALPEVFATAHDALFGHARLRMGETVLVHAIASGVGTAALQLAHSVGARVVGTSRSTEKLDRCAELGLEFAVNTRSGSFAKEVAALAPTGCDVVLDTIGAKYLEENLQVLARQGRIVTLGLLGGAKGEINLGALLAKRATWMGSVLRARPLEEKAGLAQIFRREMVPLFERGALVPVVDAVLPMEEVAEAHRRMDHNETFGKIVLTW